MSSEDVTLLCLANEIVSEVPIMKVITRVEDVVKAVLQKGLGLLWPTLDHCVTVLPQPQAKLITHVGLTAVSHRRL